MDRDWDLWIAAELAERLAEVRPEVDHCTGGVNWQEVMSDELMAALVYVPLPLVVAEPVFAEEAADLLDGLVVVPEMTDFDEVLFCFDRSKAEELLPYPLEWMPELDLDGFTIWDFMFDTL